MTPDTPNAADQEQHIGLLGPIPAGPWTEEEDCYAWQDAQTGLPCLIVRNPILYTLSGYVGLSYGHPYYGLRSDQLPELHVHGDVTMCGTTYELLNNKMLDPSGLPQDYETVWWVGFDCAHAGVDLLVAQLAIDPLQEGVYRDVAFVRGQCTALAEQLHDIQAQETERGFVPEDLRV